MSESEEVLNEDSVRMQNVSLVYRKHEQVRGLPGFKKKTHQVPDEVNARTEAFVSKLASEPVKEDLDQVFGKLRSAFRFKRNEIESTDWDDGSGSVTTPYFRYVSSVTQNPKAADEAIWKRDVSQINDLTQVLTENFAEAFGEVFDTVEFAPADPISLEEIIDRVESIDDERVWIEYDRHLSYCEIALDGCDETIHVTQESFRIVHPMAQAPRVLVDSLFRIQDRLLGFSDES